MHKQTVSVVIPSWNSESQLKQNLPAVLTAASQVDAEIVIVDDASRDDHSAQYLRSLGDKIRLYENTVNSGFSSTVNRGVELAKGDIVMLLNTDVRPEHDCFVNALKQFADPSVYAITFNSGDGWAAGSWHDGLLHHSRTEPTSDNKNKLNPSLWASGGQAAFDRSKWLELGGMDLMYKPFYWEDVDMGYRAWKRGWQILWDPASRCIHDHQKSVILSHFTAKFVTDTALRNQLLFVWKNITDASMLRSHIMSLPRFIKNYPKPFFQALSHVSTALRGRSLVQQSAVKSDQEILAQWS